MTIAQIYEILGRQEHVSTRLNFFNFLFITWSVFVVYWLVEKDFSLQIEKTLPFIKIRVFATFKLVLFEQIVKLRSTLKNGQQVNTSTWNGNRINRKNLYSQVIKTFPSPSSNIIVKNKKIEAGQPGRVCEKKNSSINFLNISWDPYHLDLRYWKSATQYAFSENKFQNTNIRKGCNIYNHVKNMKYTFRSFSLGVNEVSTNFLFIIYLNL